MKVFLLAALLMTMSNQTFAAPLDKVFASDNLQFVYLDEYDDEDEDEEVIYVEEDDEELDDEDVDADDDDDSDDGDDGSDE